MINSQHLHPGERCFKNIPTRNYAYLNCISDELYCTDGDGADADAGDDDDGDCSGTIGGEFCVDAFARKVGR